MATATEALTKTKEKSESFLVKKYGPLPVWGYLLAVVGLGGGYWWYKRR